ncbi:hypothetical protein IQ268_11325 [Oculatella sp. LEGE 06141]|uniref:hypothetical protein n=1 Tax=Oculatella sp. LEGE 06141 TaxID=1828648 RepID=UPI001882FC9A|nr:hypothetical protein [Oculatella sp. LEGE 06141]MBE9179151.1 hypothetical protein [Oculatella sp. LEGE 06141]
MSHTHRSASINRWYQRLIALLALLNLLLVFFDVSYVFWRDFYLKYAPEVVELYDPFKAIRPHPETVYYLDRVDALEAEVFQTGLESSQTDVLLADLRTLSQRLVDENPFAAANKSRSLAKIEREISDRVNTIYSREGFNTFWSADYLGAAGWQQELTFFNQELRPLIAANYYRNVDGFGHFINRFWRIDLPFVLIFALDILGRTYAISRRRPDLNWLEALLRRWWDWFLVIPVWRWLRLIPVTLRLYKSELLDLSPVQSQLNHDVAVGFAQELTEMVGIQMIDQMQTFIQRGSLAEWLFHPESRRPYVQVNNTNEMQAIATRLLNVSVYDVVPQIQPDIQALIHHSLNQTLSQSPVYQQLKHLPGVGQIPAQLTERLARDLSHAAYGSVVNALEDPVGAELTTQLSANFRQVLEAELKKSHNIQQIQDWLVDLLEEIKINYVRTIAEGGMEKVVEEAEQLQRLSIKRDR